LTGTGPGVRIPLSPQNNSKGASVLPGLFVLSGHAQSLL
jgi:hypothetical protein